MIPVLGVPVLTRPELLYRMLESLDHPVERLIVIDNGDCVSDTAVHLRAAGMVTHVTVLHLPTNLGVPASWNLIVKATPFAPSWLVVNFDATFPAGSLAAFDEAARPGALVLSGGDPAWCAFAVGEHVVSRVGLFDEFFHPAYFEDVDYARRVLAAGLPIIESGIPVRHDNSSTLNAGYHGRNARTFDANCEYNEQKRTRGDMSEGHWSLERRRGLTWD